MKILDFFGFDNVPPGNIAAPANGATLASTRLQFRQNAIGSYASCAYSKQVPNPDEGAWIRTNCGTATYPNPFNGMLAIPFDDIQPGLKDATSKLTMGVRQVLRAYSNMLSSNMTIGVLHENDTVTRVCQFTDWNSITLGLMHYWEAVFDRVNGKVKLVRDGLVVRTVDVAAAITAYGKVKAFTFGHSGQSSDYGNGSCAVDHRDVYLALIEDGDPTDRLGSQIVKRLPVASVDAGWSVNVAGSTLVDSLNDTQTSPISVPAAAAMTFVNVDEADPKGLISFSTAGLAANDRVNAINMQLDAIGTAGASSLDAIAMRGATVESTKQFTFTQTFDYTKTPLLSNFAKAAFLRQWTGTPGTKADVDSYKLRLKASS
jgi:hypothetical protein